MKLAVDARRVADELERLANFSDAPAPAVTRIVFTPPDLEARSWLKALCVDAHLKIEDDPVGNMFARWTGSDPSEPAVATGSHIDAIPNSGRYDGTVGVLGALEAIRVLQRAAFRPRRSIELILFTSEEPTRFGLGCLGSRLLSGTLGPERAAALRDADGKTFDEVRHGAGFKGSVCDVPVSNSRYHAFVELHIEQGPVLDQQGTAIGAVTDIAAPATLRITVRGEGGHAGALLMPQRRDAFPGAAEIVLAVESAARSTGSPDSVATVGSCQIFPGAVNSVPNLVTLEIDVRDTDWKRRDAMLETIDSACERISAERRLEVTREVLNADAPGQCDALVVEAIVRACQAADCRFMRLVSRAYHDALFMSRIAPTGMIFIPCRAGISHRPDEYASPENVAAGIEVLARVLAELAS
jgi:ureidoglycolate amidohydrolase